LSGVLLLAGLCVASPAAAHPLGNFTVNRAIAVVVLQGAVSVEYVLDLAEIPAFSALQGMDADADGSADAEERAAYASRTCVVAGAGLALGVDDVPVGLLPAARPTLTFPPGAGGLETLRLVCPFRADLTADEADHRLSIVDRGDDGHIGWREVTIGAGAGVEILASDVPVRSVSALLTTYPVESLDAPLDVRQAKARFRFEGTQAATPPNPEPAGIEPRASASDPLAALAAADLTPAAIILGLLLAGGLGAVHALSPGHGKTLVAAYLIGSSGSFRQAAGLGLTVAATHTAGVFLLGLASLAAGELFVPERVIGWLSAGSGILVVALGMGLILQALRAGRGARRHSHPHPHDHLHQHPRSDGPHPGNPITTLRARNIVALGLVGGMVPSASALIVLLVALTTGRLVLGMALITAFGAGMAVVLGGLAMATAAVRRHIAAIPFRTHHPWVGRALGWAPLASGVAVTAAGVAVTLSAVARFA
jgi:ABC-type nickel/cobalt efflux system permease component RcnA